jgi:hypothetical protein
MSVRVKTFILIIASIIVTIFISEIGLRIAGISYHQFHASDLLTGVKLRPNAEGLYRKEGEAYVSINSDGLRDREHTKTKPANTIRIAVLGDSYAEALQVPVEKTFWSIMEKELNKCQQFSGKDVEVINFGVSGHGTTQELLTLRHRVWDYSPDIVVLTVTTGNDISDNSKELKKVNYIPYFVHNGKGLALDKSYLTSFEYRLRNSWAARIGYRIINNSRVMQILNEGRNIIRTYKLTKERQDVAKNLGNKELGLDDMIYKEPSDPVWKEAWNITEEVIVQMKKEVNEKGSYFLVATLTNPMQVNPSSSVRDAFMKQLGVHDLFYPERRIRALGEQKGFNVLNLAPILQAHAEMQNINLHGFKNTNIGGGHWNENGHLFGGKLIAEEICNKIR